MFQPKSAGGPSTENSFGNPFAFSFGNSSGFSFGAASPATQERRRVKVKTPQSNKKGSEDFGFKEETDHIDALTIQLQDLKQQLSAAAAVQNFALAADLQKSIAEHEVALAARTEELKEKRREKLKRKSFPNAFEIASKCFKVVTNRQNQMLAPTELALQETMAIIGAFIEKGAQMGCNFVFIGMRNKVQKFQTANLGFHVGYDNSEHVLYAKGGEGTFYNGSGPTTTSHDDIEIDDDSLNSIRAILSNDLQRFQLCYRIMRAGFCVGEAPIMYFTHGVWDINCDYIVLSLWGDTRHYENNDNLFIAHCKARFTELHISFAAPDQRWVGNPNPNPNPNIWGKNGDEKFILKNINWLNLQNTPSHFPNGPSPHIHLQTSEDDCFTDANEAESDAKTGKTTNDTTDENLPIAEVVNVEGDELCAIGPRMAENLIVEDAKDDNNNDDVL